MGDDTSKELDLRNALEAGTKKMALEDLKQKGFKNVKVLDEKGLEELMRRAVERVVSTQTAEEKSRIMAESRKELDRLMKEHKAARSRAQLLEADKNELIEQVEALQRELELKSELEEELLHKKFEEGTASMQAQVEEVKKRAQAIDRELERLRGENAKLESTLGTEREKVARLKEFEPKLQAALKDVHDLHQVKQRFQAESEGTAQRLAEHEQALQTEQSKLRETERARAELVEQVLQLQAKGAESARTTKELEALRAELAKVEELLRNAAKENSALKARAADLETRLQEMQVLFNRATADTARLEGENGPLRKEVQHLRAGLAALEAQLAEERSKSQSGAGETALLRERLESTETRARERQAGLEEARAALAALEAAMVAERNKSLSAGDETAALRVKLDEARDREAALTKRLAEADRVEVERVHLQQELDRVRSDISGLEGQRVELEAARRALEDARTEVAGLRSELARIEQEHDAHREKSSLLSTELEAARKALGDARLEGASLRGELDRLEKEREAQREQAFIVTGELEEIEEKHQTEQQELEALRQVSKQLEDQLAKTRQDLAQAHTEMTSLQELLQREQDFSRDARNESATIHSRLQDLTGHSARLEEQLRGLSDENDRLQQRLKSADAEAVATGGLADKLAQLERLIELSRQASGTTRASIGESKAVTDALRRALTLTGPKKKRKPQLTLQGGIALDGHGLLEEFFRRIRLKERLQKHVPIKEKDGQRHPSELLQDVVAALIAGDKRTGKSPGDKLEILGSSAGPDVADLRQFLGRVSPRASHAVSRVHEGLRNNLFSPPEKPARIVLDVSGVPLPRSYRPRVAFDPERKEFVNGELRTIRDKDTQGIVPFLKESITKLPGAVPPSRVRFRLDSSYFSEDVIRFLNRRGCSYVMLAPELAAIRDAAKKARFRELSGGWEDGEFEQRIHPIRKTMGRFVVVRHRLSRKNGPEIKPQFRDKKFEYCVFVVDGKLTPWRAYQAYLGRAASEAASAAGLKDFTNSKLLGKKRRQHGALFPLYLMASDLVQWFRRKALPMDERDRSLDSLRTELLKLPTTQERMGRAGLPVVPKRDASRKAFDKLTRNIRRLRPVKPFRFRK
ncbi:MAG: transposase [Planctomycetaceae bacterium]|nr:transposase [Planctomycetaceae bacterium]